MTAATAPEYAFGPMAGDVLQIVRAGVGETHAAYPDALRTLCGLRLYENELEPVPVCARLARRPPACEPCRATAATWDEIDASAPRAWFRGGA